MMSRDRWQFRISPVVRLRDIPVAMVLAFSGAAPACALAGDLESESAPPSMAVSYARRPVADFSDLAPGATVKVRETQIFASLWRAGSGQRHVDIGLDYQYTHYGFENIASRDRDQHRLQAPLRFVTSAASWRVEGYVAPGISTSSNVLKDLFNRAGADDFWLAGRFEAARPSDPRAWIVGMAYDRSFGEPRLYPILGVRTRVGPDIEMRVAFPQSSIAWRASDRNSAALRVFPAGHEWHVVTDDFSTTFKYRVEAWRSQLTWTFRPWHGLALDLSFAREYKARHEFVDASGSPVRSDVADQWIGSIGFRVGGGAMPLSHGIHL